MYYVPRGTSVKCLIFFLFGKRGEYLSTSRLHGHWKLFDQQGRNDTYRTGNCGEGKIFSIRTHTSSFTPDFAFNPHARFIIAKLCSFNART